MLKEAIYHRPKQNYAYAFNNKMLHIKIRTKKGDLDSVYLIYGDPYEWKEDGWQYQIKQMSLAATDDLFDYWFIEIIPLNRRLRYGFKLVDKDNTLIYTEKGFFTTTPKETNDYFSFPFLNNIDVYRAPDWVKDTIWYEIFPERFANGDPTNDPENVLPWGSEAPKPTSFFGGDLAGIIEHLDYLKDLGINGIFLTPIFKAMTNHKYDTFDYMEIDPQFGDKKTFKQLVEEAHSRGIKIMLDAVFNHSGYYFEPFQDVLAKGEKSKYVNWFHIDNFPIETKPRPNYATFAFEPHMPKLNTENPEVKEYLLKVATYWIKEFDIDGWRLDTANEVDHSFWRDFRNAVKSIKPDTYILGEIWHDSMPWLEGDQFDAVMNYPFTDSVIQLFGKGKISPSEFTYKINHLLLSYPEHVNMVSFNLLGSHDTPRILTQFNEEKAKLKLAYLFQMSFIGTPCIYYGDELGMTGNQDPDCRKCMVWDEDKQDKDLYTFLQKLIDLRKNIPSFGNKGRIEFVDTDDEKKTFIYRKYNKEESILIILNLSDKEQLINVPSLYRGKKGLDLWKNTKLTLEVTTYIQPMEFSIIKFVD